jgi:tRNA-dihydrouridine synthase 3
LHQLNLSKYIFTTFSERVYAQIETRFIVSVRPVALPDDDSAEGVVHNRPGRDPGSGDEDEPPAKKQKLSGAQRKKQVREEKKKNRGANKGRKFGKVTDEVELCWKLASDLDCEFGEKLVNI